MPSSDLATDVEWMLRGREHADGVEECENCGNRDFRAVGA